MVNRIFSSDNSGLRDLARTAEFLQKAFTNQMGLAMPDHKIIMAEDALELLHGNANLIIDDPEVLEDDKYLQSLIDEVNLLFSIGVNKISETFRSTYDGFLRNFKQTLIQLGLSKGHQLDKYDQFSSLFQETLQNNIHLDPNLYDVDFSFDLRTDSDDEDVTHLNSSQLDALQYLIGEKNLMGLGNALHRTINNNILPIIMNHTKNLPEKFSLSLLINPLTISEGDEIIFDYEFNSHDTNLDKGTLEDINEEICSNIPYKFGKVIQGTVKNLVQGKTEFCPALINGDIEFRVDVSIDPRLSKTLSTKIREAGLDNFYS